MDQIDVKIAFLNGDLDKIIYVNQLKGLELKSKTQKNYLFKKSLDSLKQAPKKWCKKLITHISQTLDFWQSNFDSWFLCKCAGGYKFVYMLLYIDDMLLACHDEKEMDLK